MKSTMTNLIWLMLFCVPLPGCSVVLAATDAPEVHYQSVGVGTPRYLVIERLGPPHSSYDLPNVGRLDRFEFDAGMGDRVLRTMGYAVADILTLGLTELITTPVEAVKRADTFRADALFDFNDSLVAMEIRKESGEPVAVVGDARKLKQPMTQVSDINVLPPPVSSKAELPETESNQNETSEPDRNDCIRQCSETYSTCVSNVSPPSGDQELARAVARACSNTLSSCTVVCEPTGTAKSR